MTTSHHDILHVYNISMWLNFNLIWVFINFTGSEMLQLKKNHQYFHQVRGQLHIIGTKVCDLVLWTPLDMVIVRIHRDPEWSKTWTFWWIFTWLNSSPLFIHNCDWLACLKIWKRTVKIHSNEFSSRSSFYSTIKGLVQIFQYRT